MATAMRKALIRRQRNRRRVEVSTSERNNRQRLTQLSESCSPPSSSGAPATAPAAAPAHVILAPKVHFLQYNNRYQVATDRQLLPRRVSPCAALIPPDLPYSPAIAKTAPERL